MITAQLDLEFRVYVNADDDEDPQHIGAMLGAMTPAWRKEDDGGVSAPYSWALWVQLFQTFGARLRVNDALNDITAREDRKRSLVMQSLGVVTGQALWGWQKPPNPPYPHQETAARMIAAYQKVLLCDEPGTGKTASAILGLRAVERRDPGTTLPIIVVCPASMVDTWIEEWGTWGPVRWTFGDGEPEGWRAVAWRGPKRHALAGHAEVYVMSYSTFGRDARAGKLDAIGAQALVLDEAHAITNRKTSQSQEARRLAKALETVILLTGTPIRNDASDLWALLNALDHPVWPAFHRWRDRYCSVLNLPYGTVVTGLLERNKDELMQSLAGQHRRVEKAEVASFLPPKVRTVRTVEMPTDWMRAYREFEKDMLTTTPDGQLMATQEPLELIIRLVQLSNGACDVERVVDQTPEGPRVNFHVTPRPPFWKLPLLREVLEERPTEQILVFAPFRSLILGAWDEFPSWGQGQASLVIGGQEAETRSRHVQRFQAGDHRVLFATTQAGGVGLTLTAASTVVFLQRPWSLVDSVQAEDRAHRIGSEVHESIQVIDLVTKGTMDEKIIKALKKKKYQADGFEASAHGIRALLDW